MGILLAFTFIVTLLGALVLLPSLGYFLLRPAAAGTPLYKPFLRRLHQ
jgi:hypothetical protein